MKKRACLFLCFLCAYFFNAVAPNSDVFGVMLENLLGRFRSLELLPHNFETPKKKICFFLENHTF
jgi:hypothetical protein